ncbi:MAG TPA: hypothetical protein VK557_19510 [Pyrinomonadaceae bacterium]|nr:hypothetical protein [Pyrinomonadaceae bacterium]
MSRKSLWLGLIMAVMVASLLSFHVDAKPKKKKYVTPSGPPTLSLVAEPMVIKACEDSHVQLAATARATDGAKLRYRWTVNGGRLRGDGPSPNWDLAGTQPGTYQAVVEVDDGRDLSCVAFSSISVVVLDCPPPRAQPVCPTVNVSCPEATGENAPVTFTANVSGGTPAPGTTPSFNWTISAGRITSGQGTPSITVDTTGLSGQTVRATLDIIGFGTPCPASCSVSIPIMNKPRKFDEYYDIARNDEKARLDNYAIQLQQEPGSQGYVIVYPSRKAGGSQAQERSQRIVDYLVNTRGIDSHRVTTVMGPAREGWLVELWVVPEGAPPPVPQR